MDLFILIYPFRERKLKKMGKFDLLTNIKEKFNQYKTYYEILGITPNNATDETVKNAYDNKCMQLKMMLKGYESEEIQEIEGIIQTTLQDAYTALKTEDSRKNYDELLRKIDKTSEDKERD